MNLDNWSDWEAFLSQPECGRLTKENGLLYLDLAERSIKGLFYLDLAETSIKGLLYLDLAEMSIKGLLYLDLELLLAKSQNLGLDFNWWVFCCPIVFEMCHFRLFLLDLNFFIFRKKILIDFCSSLKDIFIFETWNLEFGTWNLEFVIWSLKLEIWSLDFETWNWEFKTFSP